MRLSAEELAEVGEAVTVTGMSTPPESLARLREHLELMHSPGPPPAAIEYASDRKMDGLEEAGDGATSRRSQRSIGCKTELFERVRSE